MPLLVHLTSEKNIGSIRHAGIKITPERSGVFCMPVTPNYFVSHQWLRELKRRGQRTIIAVYFRISSQEIVRVGRYHEAHEQLPVGEAIQRIMTDPQPQGYEIIIPRPIAPDEIHRVRHLSQTVGWRYMPFAHGKPLCCCPTCIRRGSIKSRKLRQRYEDSL